MRDNSILALAIVILVVSGCSLLGNKQANTSNSGGANSTAATKNEIAASSDPKADLEQMSKKFIDQKFFRARLVGTGKTPLKMEMEYVAPDRFHMKNEPVMEAIIIGKDTYTKTNIGSWRKVPLDLGKTIPNLRDSFTEQGLKQLSDVKNETDDASAGEPAIVYSYKGKSPADGSVHNARIWISKSSGLPLKIEATYPAGILEKMVINYEYPIDIVIESPIKN